MNSGTDESEVWEERERGKKARQLQGVFRALSQATKEGRRHCLPGPRPPLPIKGKEEGDECLPFMALESCCI